MGWESKRLGDSLPEPGAAPDRAAILVSRGILVLQATHAEHNC